MFIIVYAVYVYNIQSYVQDMYVDLHIHVQDGAPQL